MSDCKAKALDDHEDTWDVTCTYGVTVYVDTPGRWVVDYCPICGSQVEKTMRHSNKEGTDEN